MNGTHSRRHAVNLLVVVTISLILGSRSAMAFNGHLVQEGPLQLLIAPIPDVTQLDHPYDVDVELKNLDAAPLTVSLRIDDLVDEWRPVGEQTRTVLIGPGQIERATFRITAGQGVHSALYPVHIYATYTDQDRMRTAHAVRIFACNFEETTVSSTQPPALPVTMVPRVGALPLWTLQTHRVAWRYYDHPLVYMPVGWKGMSTESSAHLSTGRITRGATRDALSVHPPWKPRGGTIFSEYRVQLPDTKPIALHFANAIRDHHANEPASDGVTFRVWVDDNVVFERHTDSKQWVEGRVDLSDYVGREVLLRLESHPGPKRNTTCDSAYWAEPMIVSGRPAPASTPEDREKRRRSVRHAIATGQGPEHMLALEGRHRVAFIEGNAGLCDGAIGIGEGNRSIVFDGLTISILGHSVGRGPSAISMTKPAQWDKTDRGWRVRHPLQLGGERFDLTLRIWAEKSGLRLKVDCPQRITDFALGPADQKAPRVYYGHGYCIVEPQAFRAGFGGHNLSTSHVGFDFEKGLSLLVATNHPPDYLEVNPDTRTYAQHTHMDATMTLVPSTDGAFDCARKYRPLYDKRPSPGLARKAGRFVFDIWGGRYSEIARTMQNMIDYGLTDSLLTVHVWQCWGYDYRLPDIYPPAPNLGDLEDMQQIARVCGAHDIPWGLHDNYIDFYPDANDYSYDAICFTPDGQPIRAWLNEGRDAQSYRWRPDRFMPFLQRNLKLIKPDLRPTSYFIDVFTSIGCIDFYDRQGAFHSMLETRRHWGEAFAWIRDYLGDNAPMTSEAGHDQLIGYLAGADCQHLQLTPENGRFCIRLPCKDWERVPWYDAVLHDKFSLHGVGYSGRYQGGRSRQDHGIESDDYISAEILEGHAMMIDRGGFGRGAVRKYWLAQDFIRSIALDTITDVRFVDGDIHRQIIDWASGARVYVNRGRADWRVADRILPPFGYVAQSGSIESSIERIDQVTVEQSRGPDQWYFNARNFGPTDQLAIRPEAVRIEPLGDNRFKLITDWHAYRAPAKDLRVFVHFTSDRSDRPDKIAFQGGGPLPTPTSRWKGTVRLGGDWIVTIPSEYGPGEYEILVGLWEPSTGARYGLLGQDDGTRRFRLGTVVVRGDEQGGRGISLVQQPKAPLPTHWNVIARSVDFGPAVTDGAFRLQKSDNVLVVTPLPDLDPFSVGIRLKELGLPGTDRVLSVTAVDRQGGHLRTASHEMSGNRLAFQTRAGEFAYQIHFEPER